MLGHCIMVISPSKTGRDHMDLLQLRYFCDAATTENFSKTARKYGVPPSDISQSIRRLENELSVSLFTRRANSISLNEAGNIFHERISQALSLIDEAKSSVSDDGNRGKINICINANRRIVMSVFEEFKRQHPDITIRTRFAFDPTSENFDLIISTEDKRLRNYKRTKLISEGLALAVNRDSVYAGCSKLDLDTLADEPFITMNEPNSLFELTRRICADHHFTPRIAIQSDDPLYIRKCVEFGLGIAIVPLFSWKGQFSEKIILKPIEGYTRTSYVYTNTRKYIPMCAREFSELLIQKCSDEYDQIL